jgi:multiple sugar transport system ATP-binding protein
MADVRLEGVSKTFPNGTQAVTDFDLEVNDGEFVVLVGPSGCGKTTVLRMMAGLEDVTDGKVLVDGEVVNEVPSRDRDVAMVFQNYALYPHMTVERNIAFGLELQGVDREERAKRAQSAAERLGLTEYLDRRPRVLSGGQRQRVAMGRAIVREPKVFLMDEPLSNLDAKLRVQMRSELAKLQDDLGVTTLYVTHDQTEAMTMGDRVAVLLDGVLQQVDTPAALYDDPVNLFVAGFIGSPSMNLVEANVEDRDGSLWVTFGSHSLRLPDELLERRSDARSYVDRQVVLGIRPEHLQDVEFTSDHAEEEQLEAEVTFRESMGSDVYLHIDIDAPFVASEAAKALMEDLGEEAETWARREHDGGQEFIARAHPRTGAKVREPIRLAVDCQSLYLFDPESGQAIRSGDRR